MEPLTPAFRRELRSRAHHLHPVVSIGHHGLTPAVLHEADVALTAHELVKVRVFTEDRTERAATLARICDALDCAPVQQIGKLLVLWRPAAAGADPRPDVRKSRTTRRRTAGSTSEGQGRGRSSHEARSPAGGPVGQQAVSRGACGRPTGRKAPTGVPRAALPRRRRGIG